MKIGNVELATPVVLAPMAGVTSLAYREFNKPFGVGLSYSEMISDCGLAYGNKQTYDYFKTSKIDRPVGLQLFGSHLDITKKAIAILEEQASYEILDINLGCPVYKVTKTGAGSSMLKDPNSLYTYMRGVVVASSKPVTAKIRLGWDENSINFKEVVDVLTKAGCSAVAIHARTAVQAYSGTANYEILKGLGQSMSIPLGISGDIFSPEAAKKAMDTSGASYVMVARGALGRPYLISDINSYLKDGSVSPSPSVSQCVNWAQEFSKMLIDEVGEHKAVLLLRGLLPHFFSGFPGYKRIRVALSESTKTYEDIEKIMKSIEIRNHL
jgi:tRNA-dihydrouridine synthase B